MSKEYREKFNNEYPSITSSEMRSFSARPGRSDEDGKPIYITEQAHREQCDVNQIIRKYDKNGLIQHVSNFEASYGDVSGIEFKKAQDQVINAKKMFNKLPSEIRKRFSNNPQELLSFMDNPNNRDEAIELGIINREWTEATDGMGEYVKKGKNVNKTEVEADPVP